jgi:hypothetical protein
MNFGLSKMKTRLDGVQYGFDNNLLISGNENETVLYVT